ncbi:MULTISPECIES: SDR family NAD(P)-dependent oxidoreductase [Alteromonas]|jgi:NAD(P)-dependent dehydrogenase (short-subunit alcohol dehydrogenase family)|uniref:3-oxoacyl-ACP reductase n=1 Tax=Alteromonas mediterranea (strain DSM 17117 / CIP 110805 / LMG 28347 / Deep ecotype) TaxID=1774373 RepID=T2DLJ7_ALTMD|nr:MULTISPECIES: SDR family NAD(P)-dependent oxidoreductase [Alteromonas]AGV53774.1 3-oxoacyl-ACP reductase [Alteromonas mediterranea DE]NQY16899.1 SDR family NAD(P)-dependent oxidoreductase [Alteromonas sp.]CAH1204231.1 Gluconate 5-dehydrogenase [Alteromonas mediterranea]
MTKNVLVTGGNRGIGLEIVKGMLSKGYKVLMGCRDEESGLEAKKDTVGGDLHIIEMPLDNETAIVDALVRAEAVYGPIDILINNAGVLDDTPWDEVNAETLAKSMQVNVNAPLTLIQQTLPQMIDRGFGRIINVSSSYGSFAEGLKGPLSYALSKAALNALTVKMAAVVDEASDSGSLNVKVNSMTPGWVHTRMGGSDAPKTPKEGADTAIWLATIEEGGPHGQFLKDREPIDW